jgi:hypothetical protein
MLKATLDGSDDGLVGALERLAENLFSHLVHKLGRMAAIAGEVTRPIRFAKLWNLFRRAAEMATKAAEHQAGRGIPPDAADPVRKR